jgi:hypothetical protein
MDKRMEREADLSPPLVVATVLIFTCKYYLHEADPHEKLAQPTQQFLYTVPLFIVIILISIFDIYGGAFVVYLHSKTSMP